MVVDTVVSVLVLSEVDTTVVVSLSLFESSSAEEILVLVIVSVLTSGSDAVTVMYDGLYVVTDMLVTAE